MRNRQRSSDQKPVSTALFAQMKELRQQGVSNRQIGKQLSLNESTVRRRLKAGTATGQLGRYKAVFTKGQEKSIVEHAKVLDARFYGLTLKSLRSLGYEYAERNGIKHPFSKITKLAGRDWTRSFMQRNRLSLRTPRKTSVARAMGFNKQELDVVFKNLRAVIQKYKIPPHRQLNMDEGGLQTVPNKLPKHVAPTGKRDVAKTVAAEQGKTVSIACAMSAVGYFPPPFFIFARKKINKLLIKDAPEGSDMAVTDSGYMNSDVFPDYLEHLIKYTKPTADDPILLILDNHVSHVNRESILHAKRNHIHMLNLPPHSSHRTQPLDRAFFRPFKAYYAEICDNWITTHPGQVVTEYHVAGFVKTAFEKSATVQTAVNGFRKTGIFPLDPNVFTDADFLPATVTDQEEEYGTDYKDMDAENYTLIEFLEDMAAEDAANPPQPANGVIPPPPSSSGVVAEVPPPPSSSGAVAVVTPLPSSSGSVAVVTPPPSTSGVTTLPPSDSNNLLVSPSVIVPVPKCSVRRERSKQSLKSTHLTSTPHLNELEEIEKEKQRQKELKENRAIARDLAKMFGKEDHLKWKKKHPMCVYPMFILRQILQILPPKMKVISLIMKTKTTWILLQKKSRKKMRPEKKVTLLSLKLMQKRRTHSDFMLPEFRTLMKRMKKMATR